MKIGFVLPMTVALALALPTAAHAQWRQFVDPRFGTSLAYPSELLDTQEMLATGATFSGAGGHLEVSAARSGISTVAELRDLIDETPGYEDVTYTPSGKNWLVVSGYRGDDIFYEKYFVKDGVVEGFLMEYPAAERHVFDPVVEGVEHSFRPGH